MATQHLAFFEALDTGGKQGLWATDGTAAGTFEVGGIGDAGVTGASINGLSPTQIGVVNQLAFFNGSDSAGGTGLWVSDGTAAGTFEIGGLKDAGVAGAFGNGFFPQNITAYRGKVLFDGGDSTGTYGLWISDGTVAGTTEIGGARNAGVSGASPNGLTSVPQPFTAFNGKAFFLGFDASNGGNGLGLWMTDGTVAGTTELGGLADAGVAGAATTGLTPLFITAAGGRMFFRGADNTGGNGLWVSDGTAAGTVEIGGTKDAGVSGAGPNGLSLNTASVELLGNLVFNGTDSSNHNTLWTSDGTAAGTVEIGGLKNAGVSDAGPNGLNPLDMLRVGNKVIFEGTNSANHVGLWVTDGTVAGTFEVGGHDNAGVAGAFATGLSFNTQPVIFNGLAMFSATDSTGSLGVWMSDGTAAGTIEVLHQNVNNVAAASAGPVTNDFNGDNLSDILWRNSTSGNLAEWTMNGGALSSGFVTSGGTAVNPDATWNIAGFGDFNGDRNADMLWRNSSGEVAAWFMNGSAISGSGDLTSGGTAVRPDASWSIVSTGDFNGDGKADILWRNTSGELTEWLMNGTAIAGSGDVTSGGVAVAPDATWSVAGSGDFNADGSKDILWRKTDGTVAVWDMNGTTIAGSGVVRAGGVAVMPDASWSVAGIGDFNGDQTSDVLWRNTSGSLAVWLMNNNNISSSGFATSNGVAVSPDATWHIVQIGDFNGDGNSDILWRNDSGALAEWLMNGTTIMKSLTPTSSGVAISPDASWTPQAKPTIG